MRSVDLSGLPRDARHFIAWNQSEGFDVPFQYDDQQGLLTILRVGKGNHGEAVLDIRYAGRIIPAVPASSVKHCILGRTLQTRHFDFVTSLGQRFADARRDYTIIDQRRGRLKSNPRMTQREVLILCSQCSAKTWMAEERVLPPKSCACGRCRYSPLSGKRSIAQTDRWMIPFFPGGEDEARQYTRGQNKKLRFRCPYCGNVREKAIAIATLHHTHSIGCACSWSVGRSFPHRLIKSVLDYLGIHYIQEASRKELPWAQSFSYDFYLPDFGVILEAHGKQHYEEGTGYFKNTLKKNKVNDAQKRKLALDHGIAAERYLEINCKKSETEAIKADLLRSSLSQILKCDLAGLDWIELTKAAWKSEKLNILEMSVKNPEMSVRALAEHFGVSRDLVKEVQVNAGIYNSQKERKLGVKRQQVRYHHRTQARNEKIRQLKKDRPQASTQEIAELVGMERHAVYRILKQSGLYDEQAEKQNKNFKISMSKKRIKDCDIQTICQMKQDHPLLSAREAGRLTGHSHSTILSVWREFGLA